MNFSFIYLDKVYRNQLSLVMQIVGFGNKETETFVKEGKVTKRCKWANIKRIVARKVDIILFAYSLKDLKTPPNNNLEKLKGDLLGYWSIRINDQFRLIFRIVDKRIEDLEVTDYH